MEYYYSEVDSWQVTHPSGVDVFFFPSGQVGARVRVRKTRGRWQRAPRRGSRRGERHCSRRPPCLASFLPRMPVHPSLSLSPNPSPALTQVEAHHPGGIREILFPGGAVGVAALRCWYQPVQSVGLQVLNYRRLWQTVADTLQKGKVSVSLSLFITHTLLEGTFSSRRRRPTCMPALHRSLPRRRRGAQGAARWPRAGHLCRPPQPGDPAGAARGVAAARQRCRRRITCARPLRLP